MTCTCTNEKKDPFSNLLCDSQLRIKKEAFSKLRAYLFYLWTFVAEQGLWEDAFDFLDEHCDLPVLFDVFSMISRCSRKILNGSADFHTIRSINNYCSFAVMEDSATLGSDMSAMTDFREAVFRHCLFSLPNLCLPETQSAKPRGPGQSPGCFSEGNMTTLQIKSCCLI